jgi:hypothetical protein
VIATRSQLKNESRYTAPKGHPREARTRHFSLEICVYIYIYIYIDKEGYKIAGIEKSSEGFAREKLQLQKKSHLKKEISTILKKETNDTISERSTVERRDSTRFDKLN